MGQLALPQRRIWSLGQGGSEDLKMDMVRVTAWRTASKRHLGDGELGFSGDRKYGGHSLQIAFGF
jgi:hypothetical protein